MTLDSIKEWLASWSEGSNWGDATVPIAKESLVHLIYSANKMRAALRELQECALCYAPGATREFTPATAASIAAICEYALEGV